MEAPSGLAGGVRGWNLGETDRRRFHPLAERSRSRRAADTRTGDRGEGGRVDVSDEAGE